MNLDTTLWLTGMAAEAVVVFLCVRKRLFADTPVFCSYILWSLIVDIGFYYIRHILNPENFMVAFVGQMITDAAFQFAVLVELGWAVLKPIRASLPRHTILILAGLVLFAGAIIWPVTAWAVPHDPHIGPVSRFCVHMEQTIGALRVVIFLVFAACSQLLSIGWRNRELQIATGLGIYSIFRLTVSLLHTHAQLAPYYATLETVVVASYSFSLFYWIVTFSQKESERQEFSPQMQNFLLTVAGVARANRIAVANSTAGGGPKSSQS